MIDVHVSRLGADERREQPARDQLQHEQRGVGEEDDQPDPDEPATGSGVGTRTAGGAVCGWKPAMLAAIRYRRAVKSGEGGLRVVRQRMF